MWLGERTGTSDATAEECMRVLAENLASPSMLAIFPLQDWLSIDANLRKKEAASERINIPSVADHYWRYRMHINIEELLKSNSFNEKVKALASRQTAV